MGGAAEHPHRSSSPLKRRASDLEGEDPSSQNDDVDMISVPPSDPAESGEAATMVTRSKRAQSVDMLNNEDEPAAPDADTESSEAAPTKSAQTGTLEFSYIFLASLLTPPVQTSPQSITKSRRLQLYAKQPQNANLPKETRHIWYLSDGSAVCKREEQRLGRTAKKNSRAKLDLWTTRISSNKS